jgi:carbonic anhydrase/acetyltransferase-like protein (isoleucine patch superfamily)
MFAIVWRILRAPNIQDGSILPVADEYPLLIGNEVTCGHRAIVHACYHRSWLNQQKTKASSDQKAE